MKLHKELVFSILIVAAAALTGVVFSEQPPVYAHESSEPHEHPEEEQPADEGAVYEYVAQPGDSFSLIARKATQTYGAIHDVSLSHAQIVYVETMFTQQAGSPLLNVGQQVTVSEGELKQWIAKALELNEAQIAAWGQYALYANFNTDSVGQPTL